MNAPHEEPIVTDPPEPPVVTDPHEAPIVTEGNKEAVRAGHTGDHLRYILLASCALVIIAFIAVALFVKS
jgi:hypothetical protein